VPFVVGGVRPDRPVAGGIGPGAVALSNIREAVAQIRFAKRIAGCRKVVSMGLLERTWVDEGWGGNLFTGNTVIRHRRRFFNWKTAGLHLSGSGMGKRFRFSALEIKTRPDEGM